MVRYYLAIDIGASSGRHILAHLEDGRMVLEEVHRFPNGMADQAVQMLDQGRFSRAGMSDETDKLTVRDLQVDILQSVNLISGIFCIRIIYIFDFN